MPRQKPPPGYLYLKDATELLNERGVKVGSTMLYKYVLAGRLARYGAESRKQKYYSIEELEKLAAEELAFHQAQEKENTAAMFARAIPEDMHGVFAIAQKLFQSVIPISAERRQEWMQTEPRGHYVVKKQDGTIVAYVHFLALSDLLIERYMRGEIYGKQLTASDVLPLVPGRPLSCIIPSIASDPEIKKEIRSNYMGVLFRGIARELTQLGQQGIWISKMYAWTEWNDGIELCAKMGMEPWSPPVKQKDGPRRYNYWLDVLHSPMPLLAGYQRALQEWQDTHLRAIRTPETPQRRESQNLAPASHSPPITRETRPTRATRVPSSRAREHIDHVEANRPPGALTLQEYADQLGITRPSLYEQAEKFVKAGGNYTRIPHPARAKEVLRYFTSEEQAAFSAWRSRKP